MYMPTLARFQSRDPVREDGVDILYPPPELDPYRYVRNNPVNQVDPSGLSTAVCCECDELWRQLRGESDYQYDFYLIRAGENTCRVNVSCEPVKPCNALPGKTYPPKPVKNNPLYNWEIDICVSCRFKPTDLVFHHELVHARQFCEKPKVKVIRCPTCVDIETEAHEVSCRMAFPNDATKFARCVKCGVAISCQQQCRVRRDEEGRIVVDGKPCDLVTDMGGSGPWTPEVKE